MEEVAYVWGCCCCSMCRCWLNDRPFRRHVKFVLWFLNEFLSLSLTQSPSSGFQLKDESDFNLQVSWKKWCEQCNKWHESRNVFRPFDGRINNDAMKFFSRLLLFTISVYLIIILNTLIDTTTREVLEWQSGEVSEPLNWCYFYYKLWSLKRSHHFENSRNLLKFSKMQYCCRSNSWKRVGCIKCTGLWK